jgi:hypothetical protein
MEKPRAAAMFDLIVQEGKLPTTMEKLVPMSFIGSAAVKFYQAKVKLMDQLNVSEEQRKATLADGQDAGEMLLNIEARIGELALATPSAPTAKKGKQGGSSVEPLKHERLGMTERRLKDTETIYHNPIAVAEVIKEAKENEDIPTKTAVLKHIALAKLKEKEIKKEKTLPDINEAARDIFDKLTECLSKLVKIWEHKEDLNNYNRESIHDVVVEINDLICGG